MAFKSFGIRGRAFEKRQRTIVVEYMLVVLSCTKHSGAMRESDYLQVCLLNIVLNSIDLVAGWLDLTPISRRCYPENGLLARHDDWPALRNTKFFIFHLPRGLVPHANEGAST